MAGSREQVLPDVDQLSSYMRALGSPIRLQLLWALRLPASPAQVRIPAAKRRSGLRAERNLSRPAIVHHLGLLEELGLVQRVGEEGFVVNQQKLFAILDQVGGLARIRAVVGVDVDQTMASQASRRPALPEGPRLVLVAGPEEGRGAALHGAGPWTVGRDPAADLCLDYDPHVSRRHLVVERDGPRYLARAERGSKNPVLVNFRPLDPGEGAPLADGAILSLGSSRIVFQTA